MKTEVTVKEDKCCCPFIRDIYITVLAPVVQLFYGEFHRINPFPEDKYYGYKLRYPMDKDLSIRLRYLIFKRTRACKSLTVIQTSFKSGSSFVWDLT